MTDLCDEKIKIVPKRNVGIFEDRNHTDIATLTCTIKLLISN